MNNITDTIFAIDLEEYILNETDYSNSILVSVEFSPVVSNLIFTDRDKLLLFLNSLKNETLFKIVRLKRDIYMSGETIYLDLKVIYTVSEGLIAEEVADNIERVHNQDEEDMLETELEEDSLTNEWVQSDEELDDLFTEDKDYGC